MLIWLAVVVQGCLTATTNGSLELKGCHAHGQKLTDGQHESLRMGNQPTPFLKSDFFETHFLDNNLVALLKPVISLGVYQWALYSKANGSRFQGTDASQMRALYPSPRHL